MDAALQQHIEVECALSKVCKLLAKCNLTGHEEALQHAFMERMHAVHTQQLSEGDHATWFTVNFDDKEMKE